MKLLSFVNSFYITFCGPTATFTEGGRHQSGRGRSHGLQQGAQLLPLPLGVGVNAHALLDELECALVLGHFEQLHGGGRTAAHLQDHIPQELGVLLCLGLLTFFGTLWPLLRPMAMG